VVFGDMQHSCMEGAFRPWPGALTEARPQSEDCMETDGPDCQVQINLIFKTRVLEI
jgi:hypothetical protein